jgi:hypothetical protein
VIRTRRWEHGRIEGESIEHVREDLSNGAKRLRWERGGTPGLRGFRIADLPLYGATELNGADALILVEGEPAKDAGAGLDIPVLGTVTGAKSVPSDDSLKPLLGKTVYLWPDNDPDGERHMARIQKRLRALGQPPKKIRRIVWNDGPPKGDLADWRATDGTPANLAQLVKQAPAWDSNDEAQNTSANDAAPTSRLVVSSLSNVVSQSVAWDWYRWLARGKFHIVAGHAGDGKSTLLASLAATGSQGGQWPDGTFAPRVLRTLFLLGEDSAADTLRPRLELHDADMDEIFVNEAVLDEHGRERFFNIGKHLDLLEEEIVEHRIDWIVIDPLTTIMPGTDRNAEGDTRDALTPLIKLAERRNVAIIGVAHVGKSGDARRAAQKILGATAFHALARVVWMVAPDDDRMVLGVVKSNFAMRPPSLVWTRDENGPIVWEGVSANDVEDLLAHPAAASPRSDAEGLLRDLLARGSRASEDIERAGKEREMSFRTLRRAADVIGVKKFKEPGKLNGRWFWCLPDGSPQFVDPTSEQPAPKLASPTNMDVANFGDFEEANMANGGHGGPLHGRTPISPHDEERGHRHEIEGGQVGHWEFSRSGQLREEDHNHAQDAEWAGEEALV